MKIASLRGLLDFKSGHIRYFYRWGFAMNGMTSRLEAIRQIIFSLKIERIIETGTFRGTTAEWFAQFRLPLETVELIDRYYAFSKARLRSFSNATVFLGSSTSFLRERISKQVAAPDIRQLFYLDSHWEHDLPLREEVELIFNHYSRAIVVIDDFEVADDRGYGFDSYSEVNRLTTAYLATASVPRQLIYFYPSTRAENETGARRGWTVITDNLELASELDQIRLIRRASA